VNFHGFAGLTTAQGDFVESPVFTCFGHRWRLMIFPGSHSDSEVGMASVRLCNMSEESIKVDFVFSIRGSDGSELSRCPEEKCSTVLFTPRGTYGCGCRCSDFVKRSDIMNALQAGALLIEVRLRRTDSNPPSLPFIAENPFSNEMLKLFTDEESADILFEVEDSDEDQGQKDEKSSKKLPAKFYAHRIILKQCAPTLAGLCASAEGLASVPISGIKPEIFRIVLHYVYGGKPTEADFKSHAKEIVDTANKLGVVNLKLEAEVWYVKLTTIGVGNVTELLLYADRMSCALLKEAVMEFIVDHGDNVLENVSLKDAPGGLLADLLVAMARGKKKYAGVESGDDINFLRISDLRKKLHEKGLDIDGSRETLIATLKGNA